ncbi:hypothetical protein HZS_194 [Henneguya salminicola]|nr:hypothetical protein HZS_194 [Henneguya salminicola]
MLINILFGGLFLLKMFKHQRCSQFNTFRVLSTSRLAIKRAGSLFFRRLWMGGHPRSIPYYVNMATNESLARLRYNSHTFIDSTFRCPPHPFAQYLSSSI